MSEPALHKAPSVWSLSVKRGGAAGDRLAGLFQRKGKKTAKTEDMPSEQEKITRNSPEGKSKQTPANKLKNKLRNFRNKKGNKQSEGEDSKSPGTDLDESNRKNGRHANDDEKNSASLDVPNGSSAAPDKSLEDEILYIDDDLGQKNKEGSGENKTDVENSESNKGLTNGSNSISDHRQSVEFYEAYSDQWWDINQKAKNSKVESNSSGKFLSPEVDQAQKLDEKSEDEYYEAYGASKFYELPKTVEDPLSNARPVAEEEKFKEHVEIIVKSTPPEHTTSQREEKAKIFKVYSQLLPNEEEALKGYISVDNEGQPKNPFGTEPDNVKNTHIRSGHSSNGKAVTKTPEIINQADTSDEEFERNNPFFEGSCQPVLKQNTDSSVTCVGNGISSSATDSSQEDKSVEPSASTVHGCHVKSIYKNETDQTINPTPTTSETISEQKLSTLDGKETITSDRFRNSSIPDILINSSNCNQLSPTAQSSDVPQLVSDMSVKRQAQIFDEQEIILYEPVQNQQISAHADQDKGQVGKETEKDAIDSSINSTSSKTSEITPNYNTFPKPAPRNKKNKSHYGSKNESSEQPSNRKSSASSYGYTSSENIYDLDAMDKTYDYGYTTENIYSEIEDLASDTPRPRPRRRKKKRDMGSHRPVDNPEPQYSYYNASIASTNSAHSSEKSAPDWLQNRGPIPSPRRSKLKPFQKNLIKPEDSQSARNLHCTIHENVISKSFETLTIATNHSNSRTDEQTPAEKITNFPSQPESPKLTKTGRSLKTGRPTSLTTFDTMPSVPRKSDSEVCLTPSDSSVIYGQGQRPPRRKRKPVEDVLFIEERSNAAHLSDKLHRCLPHYCRHLVGGDTWGEYRALSEALLTDVLHCLHHTLGSSPSSTWTLHTPRLGPPPPSATPPPPSQVSFAEVRDELQSVFEVDSATLEGCLGVARGRGAARDPQLHLHLTVHEARDLKDMSVSRQANPYITASVPGDSHQTRVVRDTTCPQWGDTFSMRVRDIHKDYLKLQVWHEHQPRGVGAVLTVKDIKGLGRLVKACADKYLLGEVSVPLKNISDGVIDDWFPLTKEDQGNNLSTSTTSLDTSHLPNHNHTTSPSSSTSSNFKSKLMSSGAALMSPSGGPSPPRSRGEVRITARVGPSTMSSSNAKRPYDALLAKVVMKYVSPSSENPSSLWHGSLPLGSVLALHLVGLVEGVSPSYRALALWCVSCRAATVLTRPAPPGPAPAACVSGAACDDVGRREEELTSVARTVDGVWLLQLLKTVVEGLAELGPPDRAALAASLEAWVGAAEAQLGGLEASYDPAAPAVAARQLGATLRTLRLLSCRPLLHLLPPQAQRDVDGVVHRAIDRDIKRWWIQLLERELHDNVTPEQQVSRVINITVACHDRLQRATTLYSPIFVSEFSLPYLRVLYLFVTKKLNPCVRPLVSSINYKLLSGSSRDGLDGDLAGEGDGCTLTAGTSLWQLYVNMGRIHEQGRQMPVEVRQESGVKDYHRWFSKGVMHWLQMAQTRTRRMITVAVDADQLTPCDEYCKSSSSATDALQVFLWVRNWCQELSWPDPVDSGVHLGKVIDDLGSSASYYCDLLRQKVVEIHTSQPTDSAVFVTKQFCIGLNNIEKVKEFVTELPKHFNLEELIKNIATASSGGEGTARQYRGTFQRLVESARENLEASEAEFVGAAVTTASPILAAGLTAACESGAAPPLLGAVLDPGLSIARDGLSEAGFSVLLGRLWEALLGLFGAELGRGGERNTAQYYAGVHTVLVSCLEFFTPATGGLDRSEAMSDGYTSLLELLETRKVSSETLVSRYYERRVQDGSQLSIRSRGDLTVTVFFTPSAKLVIEVAMAKGFSLDDSPSPGHTAPALCSYVKVQLVPQEWFPGGNTYATKVLKKSDPATFLETFTYSLSPTDPNVSSAHLLLTLKHAHLARSNTFLGEAVVPLGSVHLAASDAPADQPRPSHLRLTRPTAEAGYPSLAGLRDRAPNDRTAANFLRKVTSRFPAEARLRKESDVEDKPHRSRSPNFLNKLTNIGTS